MTQETEPLYTLSQVTKAFEAAIDLVIEDTGLYPFGHLGRNRDRILGDLVASAARSMLEKPGTWNLDDVIRDNWPGRNPVEVRKWLE